MNIILTAYLTVGKDGQTGKNWNPNTDDLIPLLKSFLTKVENPGILVVFHDCFTNEQLLYMSYPFVSFIKVTPRPNTTANRYRWIIFKEYLEQNSYDNVFCLDARDVEIFKDPFKTTSTVIITGSEKQTKVDSTWMRNAQQPFVTLPDYQTIISENKRHILLNCGIIGGQYITVLEYLTYICKYQSKCNPPNNKSIDMAIHNYTIFKHFKDRFEFGIHINTEFRANERAFNNNTALFKHK